MTIVRIPPPLRADVGGERQVEADGDTVGAVLDDLIERFPTLRTHLVENGDIAPFVNVYLEGEDVRTLDGLETPVLADATVILLPAMAGGMRAARTAEPKIARNLLDLVGNTPLVEL